jgi:prepilin peptidase CpaA
MGWDQVSIALLGVLALLLISAAVEDIRIREIADWKNIAIAALAPAFWWATGYALWPDVAIQLGIGLAVFGVFTLAFMAGQMGGGDVKMLGALALWFPWQPLLSLLMVMAIAGGVLTIMIVVIRKIRRKSGQAEIPYGVAIAFAGLISIHQPILNHFG